MSERILKALMQLFAIVAKVDSVTHDGRSVVKVFLKQQLNAELVQQYLNLFEEFLEKHQKISKRKEGKERKRTSVNSVKVLRICTQINEELAQKQKVVVLLRLLEFIFADEYGEQELEFVTTVAETFNIPEDEFKDCMDLVLSKDGLVPNREQFLVVSKEELDFDHAKSIQHDYLEGVIKVLKLEAASLYLAKYVGNDAMHLNGQVIENNRVYFLTHGSSFRSPKVKPIYFSDITSKYRTNEEFDEIDFVIDELEFKFPAGNIGLHELNLVEKSGNLIGIMGASGAGKSTLLSLLNGSLAPTSGSVKINGIDIHAEPERLEGVIGHISQDDLLIEDLTVFQNLYYNAKLCFDGFPENTIVKKTINLLKSLGLYEIRDLKVGSPLNKKISGGQRKRLNIALELIREPQVLFVDEPTSGLSSRDSENIMDLLKELALKGKLVFVVIHQPSSDIFKMFDNLLILDTGGFPIYYGNPVDAVIYFKTAINHVTANESECFHCGNVNPEQIFNIIETKVVDEYGNVTETRRIPPKSWNKIYEDEIPKPDTKIESSDIPKGIYKIPRKLSQFRVFFIRDILSKLANTQYMLINFLEGPFLAFILAYMVKFYSTKEGPDASYVFKYNENLTAYLFMSVVVALFMGLTVSAEEIIRDRKILKRESFLNLSRFSYLSSKVSIMFIISAIQTLTYILIGNLLLGIKGMYIDYWLVLFVTSCFANMLGLNISSSFNSVVTIYILIPILLIPQLLLSGVIVKFDKLNPTLASQTVVPLSGDMMASRWAFEALAVNQFKENDFQSKLYPFEKRISMANYKKNYWAPAIIKKSNQCKKHFENPDKKELYDRLRKVVLSELHAELPLTRELIYEELHDHADFFENQHSVQNLHITIDSLQSNIATNNRIINEVKAYFIPLKESLTGDHLKELIALIVEINAAKQAVSKNEYYEKDWPALNQKIISRYKGNEIAELKKALRNFAVGVEKNQMLLSEIEKRLSAFKISKERMVRKVQERLLLLEYFQGVEAYVINYQEDNHQLLDDQFAKLISKFCEGQKRVFNHIFNKESTKKNETILALRKEVGNENYLDYREQYQNDNLTDLVTNKNEINKIIEHDGKLVQKQDPVYKDAAGFKAHFFAPNKVFFGIRIDTFWANILVILSMSFFMFITLYFDVLKRIIDWLGELTTKFGLTKKS